MERLTAFEFIAATDAPQLVRLTCQGTVILQFGMVGWLGVDLSALDSDLLTFAAREDLVIEGQGLGHPYWNGAPPSWTLLFDGDAEARRIDTIRRAALREVNRASLSLM